MTPIVLRQDDRACLSKKRIPATGRRDRHPRRWESADLTTSDSAECEPSVLASWFLIRACFFCFCNAKNSLQAFRSEVARVEQILAELATIFGSGSIGCDAPGGR